MGKIRRPARRNLTRPAIFVMGVILVGCLLLILTHAASNAFSAEAEDGIVTAPAKSLSSSSASHNSFARFTTPSSSSVQPQGAVGNWTMSFADEFNGTSLDTSKWDYGWADYKVPSAPVQQDNEQACYDPSQVSVANGELTLSVITKQASCGDTVASKCNATTNTRPYTSGNIQTRKKYTQSYGFAEARIWLDADANNNIYNWPAWWLDGEPWPSKGETDVMEGLGGTGEATWHGPVDGGSGHNFGHFGPLGGWHTFGADWEPGIVTSYVDGKKISSYSDSANIVSGPQFFVLGLQMTCKSDYITKSPSQMKIDYVRAWQKQ